MFWIGVAVGVVGLFVICANLAYHISEDQELDRRAEALLRDINEAVERDAV